MTFRDIRETGTSSIDEAAKVWKQSAVDAGLKVSELKQRIKELEAEVKSLMETPPCRECGAMTLKEAETRCRCGGDKDHCHGIDLWEA